VSDFSAVDLICAKRDGRTLRPDEIAWFIDGYTNGAIPDEQASALLMAIYFQAMEPGELATWTQAMIDSGERLDLSSLDRPTVDKHSTGGVGDKVSLVLAPLVAACGAAVPQLSGRGLGYTGGTLDKLEAVAGWRAALSNDEILTQLGDVGAVICAAGAGLAPADQRIYALRDVTGTVPSVPLIASSIMSKKIAEGTNALVLDVKVGSGAFARTESMARPLAEAMIALGEAHGVRTAALLTRMDTPLGRTAGNGLEVTESVETLAGGGPADLVDVTLALAREMVALAGLDADPAAVLASGQAMDVWRAMIAAQGGDPDTPIPEAPIVETVTAPADGILGRLDAMAVGIAAWRLGAGRARKEDPVSATAGVVCRAKEGDAVRAGDTVLELHTEDGSLLPGALAALDGGFDVVTDAVQPPPIVLDRVSAGETA
jgi:thymidine phosphorylase